MSTPQPLSPREGYAAWSSCYDEDGNPLIALEEPVVQGWFGPLQGRWALDIGCGTGRHTIALAHGGAKVLALDQSPEMLRRAREKLRGHEVVWISHALPTPLPIKDASVDLAVLGLVLEHVPHHFAVFTEVGRVLRPGGHCVISALHPDRTAEGQTARFIDPITGERRPIVTYHRTIDEYLAAGHAAGLDLRAERTLIVPSSLGEQLPRARRYVGMALGWAACWSRGASVD